MFGIFKSPPFSDSQLGKFHRKGGVWRGAINLGGVSAPLALPGSRTAPDAQALDIARSIPPNYPKWRRLLWVHV